MKFQVTRDCLILNFFISSPSVLVWALQSWSCSSAGGSRVNVEKEMRSGWRLGTTGLGAGHWLDKMKTGGASLSIVLIHFHLNFILGITQHKIIYIFLVLKIYLCIQTIWVEEWIWIFSKVVAIKNAKIVYFWNV